MLWANMLLHMAADPQPLLQQWHAALAVDGFLMFSCLGPDTLARTARRVRGAGLAAARP
jgi:malonyl-CoA O-methyltransferase